MSVFYENIGHVALMLALLCGSAFFSAAETAFFSLSQRQIQLLKKSNQRLHRAVSRLLAAPGALLDCLLFGNMTVNVLFFAAASVVSLRLKADTGITSAAVWACTSFAALVLFGEIVPKSLAYANARSFSIAASLVLSVLVRIFQPVEVIFKLLIVEPSLRLLIGSTTRKQTIRVEEFQTLMAQVSKRGLITASENKLVTEIIELGFLKIWHVMQPRVDMPAYDVTDSNQSIREAMLAKGLTKAPVYVRSKDNVVGLLYLRQLLLRPDESADKLVQQVCFVPEQQTVESLLEFFRTRHVDTAIVVDEYGGIAGSVCLEDIVAELLGPIEPAEDAQSIEQLGPLEYRLAGDLAIHDWAEAFGIDPVQRRLSTIGGLVAGILGKIPKVGDTAHLKNLTFTIERMRRHRVESVILKLESIANNDH